MKQPEHIWIFGDSPLVEEFTAVCVARGLNVRVRINGEGRPQLPTGSRPLTESDTTVDLVFELTNLSPAMKMKNLAVLDQSLSSELPILSSSVTVLASEQAGWLQHPERHVGIGAFPTLIDNEIVEVTPSHKTSAATRHTASSFIVQLGKSPVFVADSIGMVMPRILCMLINEASYALMEDLATGADIDTAMKLGTNYPHGPLEWAERISPAHVHAVISAMHQYFGEERYRPSPYLKRAHHRGTFAAA